MGPDDEETAAGFVNVSDIPTAGAVGALAAGAGALSGVWWRELQTPAGGLLGPALGEMAALTADRVDPAAAHHRRLPGIGTRHAVALAPPKNRRRRTTMYPARTPGGADLAALVARPLAEVGPDELLFPPPGGAGPGAPTTAPTP